MLGSLLLGVRERNIDEEMAIGLVNATRSEVQRLRLELEDAHARRVLDGDWAWADTKCRRIRYELRAAQPLVTRLFADDGEGSLPLPAPVG
ncbi:hypothetical protein [Streptomyces sp. NPDC087300]|uniref:hypothetical protein n=1 Tax=Streptomyces sp. NPDC087300 TaxID=3365780 RepID=UPI003827D3D2